LRRKREEMQKFWAWTLKTRPSWRESKVGLEGSRK
jgi:hypothetical protein